jgi:hypothetical protein
MPRSVRTDGSWSVSRRVERGFYTVGLVEHLDHPELVVAGFDLGHATHVVNDLGELIRDGARFEAGQPRIEVPGARVSFGSIHPVHVTGGLMNLWSAHAERREHPPHLVVLQALLDPAGDNLRLDRPHTTLHRPKSPHPRLRRR